MKRALIYVTLVTAACAAACGSGGTDNNNTDVRGEYPAGPYGKTEGSIIEPLMFTLADGTPRTLEDIYKDSSKKLLLATTSAPWCTACIDEQPELKSFHEEFAAKGLSIMVAVFEDGSYNPATTAVADTWKRQYELPFDVVADPEFKLGQYYDRTLSPMNIIVDVSKMKILRISTGFDPNATKAIIMSKLQ